MAVDTKGTAWLVETVEAKTGKKVEGKVLRTLLRKLVAAETIEKPEGRWSFSGLKDPAVVAIIKAVKAGEHEPKPRTGNADNLAKARAARKAKAAKVEDELEEDELEDLDLEDL